MTFNIRLIFKQASKKHHSNIQSVSMCFQNLGPPRFIPIIMQVWRLPAWIPARPVSSLSKFQTSKWTGAQSLASSQENRQKWREFCYGFENLKEWGTQLFYAFVRFGSSNRFLQLAFRVAFFIGGPGVYKS